MHHRVKSVLILVAAFASGWAAVSSVFGLDADFKVAFVAALLCLGGVFVIDHRGAERERMALGRQQVWDRRDFEEWDDEFESLREVD